MKDDIENSWAPHTGFKPLPSAQQTGIVPLDLSADLIYKKLMAFHIICFSQIAAILKLSYDMSLMAQLHFHAYLFVHIVLFQNLLATCWLARRYLMLSG